MKILITGSEGFMGKNLIAVLRNLKQHEILTFDLPQNQTVLSELIDQADLIFHFAQISHSTDPQEFTTVNVNLTQFIMSHLLDSDRAVPIVLSSSIQADQDSPYGFSKLQAELQVFHYARVQDVPSYVFRFPDVFGKWAKPNKNSAIATFCYNLAHDLPIQVMPALLQLVYIDDLVKTFLKIIDNDFTARGNGFSYIEPVFETSTPAVADILREYAKARKQLKTPEDHGLLGKYLYATFLSYFPAENIQLPLDVKSDERGSFAQFVKDPQAGQVSVNKTSPGQTKGNHWHASTIERFCNIQGEILFRQRWVGTDQVTETRLSGDQPTILEVPPGVIHNFTNIGDAESVTLIWASELFDPENPDTFYESV